MPAHIVVGRFVLHGSLDAEGQEAEDGPDPQQDGEAPEELTAELHPLRGGWGWGEGIGSIPSQNVLGPLVGEALREVGRGEGAEPTSRIHLALHHFPPGTTSQGHNVQVEGTIPPGWKGWGSSGEATWRRWHLQWVLEILKAEDMGCGSPNSGQPWVETHFG